MKMVLTSYRWLLKKIGIAAETDETPVQVDVEDDDVVSQPSEPPRDDRKWRRSYTSYSP